MDEELARLLGVGECPVARPLRRLRVEEVGAAGNLAIEADGAKHADELLEAAPVFFADLPGDGRIGQRRGGGLLDRHELP